MKHDDSASAKLQELLEKRKLLDQELSKLSRKVAVMFADIVGSTRFFEKFGDVAGLVYVHKCMDMLSPVAEKHGGTICKTIGDALMTYFEDPAAAIRAAMDMQRTLDAYNSHQDDPEQIHVRIGMNYGMAMIKEKDVFGDVVNTAARIQTLAKVDAIYVSGLRDEDRSFLESKLKSVGVPFHQVAEAEVKGKAERVVAYEVLWRDAKIAKAVEVVPLAPQMAGRVDVAKAAETPHTHKGTAVLDVSPVARITKPRLKYSLLIVRPDGSHGEERPIEKPLVTLGRVDGEILFPDDPLVSRRHARFTVSDEGLAVEDLNSANGIFWRVNKPYSLRNSDIILMGRQMFRFVTPRRPAAAAQPAKPAPPEAEKTAVPVDKSSAELIRLLPGGVEENHYPLHPGENILGRTRGTISFPDDPYLSGQHCSISFKAGGFVLEDLKAQNGTFVGVRERTPLADGDIILIGHQLLRITATPA